MSAGRKTRLRVLHGHGLPPEARGAAALIGMVRVVGRLTAALADVVRPHGLTIAHFEVLMGLRGGEGVSQQDLADRLLVTKGNLCVTAQKMASAGLIERRPDPTDQRVQRLYLTADGRRRLAALMPAHDALIGGVAGCLTRAEQSALLGLVTRVEDALDPPDRAGEK